MTQRNSEDRASMLAARRWEQRNRTPGFTEKSSKRVNAIMQTARLGIILEYVSGGRTLPDEIEIQREAFNRGRKQLPQAPSSKLFRRRHSKNDDPAYRGEGGLGPRRIAALKPAAKRVRKAKVAAL